MHFPTYLVPTGIYAETDLFTLRVGKSEMYVLFGKAIVVFERFRTTARKGHENTRKVESDSGNGGTGVLMICLRVCT